MTDYEMVRARNMMRNNQIFRSLGIGAIASMIRKRSDFEEVSGVTNGDTASAIINEEGSDYNPKDDEDTEGEEVTDSFVVKTVKVPTLSFFGGGSSCML